MTKTSLLLCCAICIFACRRDAPREQSSASEAPAGPEVALLCQAISLNDTLPRYAVYAVVEEYKVKLAEISGCESISAADYGSRSIPAGALTAAGGWWAGLGEYFYAQYEGGKVDFYHGQVDEAQSDTGIQYRRIASFEKGNFTFAAQ